jgi:hypothetical protein
MKYKKKYFVIIFQKEKVNTSTLLIIFIVKSLQKEQNSTNLLLWPPICRNKHAITPKWFNSLDTNSTRYAKEYQAILLSQPPSKISAQHKHFVFGSSNVFFQCKSETAFWIKTISVANRIKHCHSLLHFGEFTCFNSCLNFLAGQYYFQGS